MPEILIDTNIIMHLFDTSEPAQTEKSKRLFEAAKSGQITLIIAPPALFEVAWVLKSALKRSNGEALDVLEAITSWPGVKVLDKDKTRQAIALAKQRNSGFADSYLAVTAQDMALAVATFNERHFKKLDVSLYNLQ
ncbi:hypothetical protein AGMMS49957_09570 [Synergistales bacterium]|nr:hypothetical protein AGMMS49957_09570 [Synergistales bacterium]